MILVLDIVGKCSAMDAMHDLVDHVSKNHCILSLIVD